MTPKPNLRVRQHRTPYYYLVPEAVALGCTEKAGYTSLMHALARVKRMSAQQVVDQGLRTRLYLRHPLERFASAWAYFTPANNFPRDPVLSSRAHDVLREHPTLEQFTDAVLDGVCNEHWYPQLEQHRLRGIEFDELYRFENIRDTFPTRFTLGHENKGRIDKPPLMHRVDELIEYYQEDYDVWQTLAS